MDKFYPILPHPHTHIRLHYIVVFIFVYFTRQSKKSGPHQVLRKWMDGWVDRWMGGWMDACIDGWIVDGG